MNQIVTFNKDERLTPTVVRRRVATVKREIDKQLTSEETAKLELEQSENKLAESKTKLSNAHSRTQALYRQLNELEEKGVELKKKASRQLVTDHAVVAFIERVLGIDVQSIRNQIIGQDGRAIRNMDGDGSIDRDNYTLVIADNLVTTILTDNMLDYNPIEKSTYEVKEEDNG